MEIGKKTIKVKNSETTNFYFIGDIHEGNCNCNHKALAEAVDIVKSDPNGYWFGMGDYIEAIIHQLRAVGYLLPSIKGRGKAIGLVTKILKK